MSATPSPSRSTDRSTPEQPRIPPVARWGAACAPCATAKAKCLRSNTTPGSKCDRCERLYKNCTDQVHKPRKKRQSRPSRTTQLEERLNRLVNSLRVSGNVSAISEGGTIPRPPALVANHQTTLPPGHPNLYTQTRSALWDPAIHFESGPITVPETYNCFVPPTCICRTEPGEAPGPPDTDESLLAIYRNEMAPSFPFVIIPPGVSATTLSATRPFLMAAIRMVCSFRSTRSMRGQMYRLMNHVADHVLLRSERSIDLLLGLVVMLGWFQHHCMSHAQLNKLIALAACLLGELGLKRSPSLLERTRLMVMRPSELRERTNEERRLLLAVWYLSSSVSLDIQQIDPLRFSPYMQQCLRELEEARELESDIHVIYIVRIQRLCERIGQIRGRDDCDEDTSSIPKAPLAAYASSFQAELDKLKAQMPRSLKDNHFLKVRMATARLRLYEPPTIDAELLASLSSSLTSLSAGTSSALDIFYQANAALKAWFEVWLAIPVAQAHSMPLTLASQMIFGVVMMCRWAWLGAGGSGGAAKQADEFPPDPSRDNPNNALAAMEAAINPNTPASTPSTSAKATPSWDSPAAAADRGRLPRVLAELRAQLATQPGLALDVSGTLNAVADQLEEVDAVMQRLSVDAGPWRANVWTLGATKVRIAQLRQKRWSEMVTAESPGGEADGEGEEEEDGEEAEGEEEEGGGLGEVEMQEGVAANMPVMGSWDFDGTWGPNLYDIVDPSLFIEGATGGDWTAAAAGLMNMGPMDQLPGAQVHGSRYM